MTLVAESDFHYDNIYRDISTIGVQRYSLYLITDLQMQLCTLCMYIGYLPV